jgi:hypothetical protein
MRLPAMSTTRLRAFATLPVVSAAVISFESVRHLAESAGFGPLAWLFPLTLDAAVAFGTDLWIRKERSAAMSQARLLALVVIVLSLAANVADHWLTTRSVLAAVLGAIPPAVLAAMLAVMHRHAVGPKDQKPAPAVPDPVAVADHQDSVPPSSAVPDHTDSADPVPLRKRTAAATRTSRRTVAGTKTERVPQDQEIRAWVRDRPEPPTKRTVMAQWGVGSSRALRLINEAKEAGTDE